MKILPSLWWCAAAATFVLIGAPGRADGIYGNGSDARAMSLGGAQVADPETALEAMGGNPAGMSFLQGGELDLGAEGGFVLGRFTKPGVTGGNLDESPEALPDGAFVIQLKRLPITVGLSVVPEAMADVNWHYVDPPGGLGGHVSYGYQDDKSEILMLRSALGASIKINSKLSFGVSAGLLYNDNRLVTPYVFQNLSPASDQKYDGAKTLLNLHTTGTGFNAMAGLLFEATPNLSFGLSYESPSTVNSKGSATGDPYAQFGAAPGVLAFHYNAAVQDNFPQVATAGASWKFAPQWTGLLQVDWLGWSGSFRNLPVSLTGGNNPKVNGVLGSSFSDAIPLNWRDEFVYRIGFEYRLSERFALRAGYAYGSSPVPDATLLPMTAAILEHTITAGVGYRAKRWRIDLAYQYSLPAKQSVGASQILSGEYSNSSTTVSAHLIALTVGWQF